MLNIGAGEIALICVAALLILGPKRLPEMARGLGKFLREFRRHTDDVRTMVEREFYKMDQDIQTPLLPQGSVPTPVAFDEPTTSAHEPLPSTPEDEALPENALAPPAPPPSLQPPGAEGPNPPPSPSPMAESQASTSQSLQPSSLDSKESKV